MIPNQIFVSPPHMGKTYFIPQPIYMAKKIMALLPTFEFDINFFLISALNEKLKENHALDAKTFMAPYFNLQLAIIFANSLI